MVVLLLIVIWSKWLEKAFVSISCFSCPWLGHSTYWDWRIGPWERLILLFIYAYRVCCPVFGKDISCHFSELDIDLLRNEWTNDTTLYCSCYPGYNLSIHSTDQELKFCVFAHHCKIIRLIFSYQEWPSHLQLYSFASDYMKFSPCG